MHVRFQNIKYVKYLQIQTAVILVDFKVNTTLFGKSFLVTIVDIFLQKRLKTRVIWYYLMVEHIYLHYPKTLFMVILYQDVSLFIMN